MQLKAPNPSVAHQNVSDVWPCCHQSRACSCTGGYLSFVPIEKMLCFCDPSVRAWSEGDVSAERCLHREAGELAGVTRVLQARPLSVCTAY
jgi:hypothetical protein